jgi:glycosyltransferase involved in cell wall biosynthesis
VEHAPVGGRYAWVGRITEPYKQLGLVISAFSELPDLELFVVGDGRDRPALEKGAPSNVRFVGWQSRGEIASLYGSVDGLIFPSEDDFGLVPVEAMMAGVPVIAFGAGGALDTVIANETGLFFYEQTTSALVAAIKRARAMSWDAKQIRLSALKRFDRAVFLSSLSEVLVG